jgi:hypothetical protein
MYQAKRTVFVATAVVASVALVGTAVAQASVTPKSTSHATAKLTGVALAVSQLKPYTNKYPKFPITTKLAKRPPKSDLVVFLQCGATQCAQFGSDIGTAVAALGLHYTVISCGLFPAQAQAAAASALALKPSAVIVAGTALSQFGNSLKPIEAKHIPILGVGTDNGPKYGLTVTLGSNAAVTLAGKLMADWVLVNKGPTANVVFYGTPELDFSTVMWMAFQKQLKTICTKCKSTEGEISVLDFGSSAPSKVVDYLRANPSINTVVFAADPAMDGLPAALHEASLSPTVFGWNPDTVALTAIHNSTFTGGALGLDTLTSCWQLVDILAKVLTKQKVPAAEEIAVIEVLNKAAINSYDLAHGWTAYPTAAALTEKLWPKAS